MSKKQHTQRETLLAWLCMPGKLRAPLTQRLLADELGVTEETLSRWKRSEAFQAELRKRILEKRTEAFAGVMDAHLSMAQGGDFQHTKMFFEDMGLHTDRTETEITVLVKKLKGKTTTDDL